jgi:hypothetical protein
MFGFRLPELCIIWYACSFEFSIRWYLVCMVTPYLNPTLICGSSYPCTLAPDWFSLCRYVQMDNAGSTSTDVETWTLVNYLKDSCTFVGHPEGFWVHHLPRVLDTWGHCRMDIPGPTTSVGTRTDYSVGPWDYPACATRHLKAWSTRTTQE